MSPKVALCPLVTPKHLTPLPWVPTKSGSIMGLCLLEFHTHELIQHILVFLWLLSATQFL